MRVVNARCLEERPVSHDGSLFVTHVQIQASARNLFTVHVQCKLIEIIMPESERVCIHRAYNVLVISHLEEALRWGSKHGIVNGKQF